LNAERGTPNGVSYTIEPHVNGGPPILASHGDAENAKVIFNDILGSSLGVAENGKFTGTNMTSFGEADPSAPESEAFFTGKPMLHGIGYAFLFRNYRAETGKWMSSDPLGYPDGWNNLAYCNNWVNSHIDILRLVDWDTIVTGADGVIGGVTEIAGSSFFVANVETFGVTQVLGVVLFMDGLGNIALGIGNITQGILEGDPIPTSYAQLAAEAVSDVTDVDADTAHNLASITDYTLGLSNPGFAGETTVVGVLDDIATGESAVSDITDNINLYLENVEE